MKKMILNKGFNLLCLMAGLMMNAVIFTACGGDDNDSSSNPIIGTWWIEGTRDKQALYTEMTFNADMSFSWREYRTDRNKLSDSDTGTYKIEGNTLYTWFKKRARSDGSPHTVTFAIDGNKMTTSEAGGITWTRK